MANPYPSNVTELYADFVRYYYRALLLCPEKAVAFYKERSLTIRVEGGIPLASANLKGIHDSIMLNRYSDIKIKRSVRLGSLDTGFLVLVEGSMKFMGFVLWNKFVQAFYITPPTHFVLYDALFVGDTYLGDPPQPLGPVPFVHPLGLTPQAYEEEVGENTSLEGNGNADYFELLAKMAVALLKDETTHEEAPSKDQSALPRNAVEFSEEPGLSVQESVGEPLKPLEEPRTEPIGEHLKPTYAHLVRVPKREYAPPPISLQVLRSDTGFHTSSADESLLTQGETPAVYVSNLPSSITIMDILKELERFGRITEVSIKNPEGADFSYAFVSFKDTQSANNAIKASPLDLFGKKVHIQKRRYRGEWGRGRL